MQTDHGKGDGACLYLRFHSEREFRDFSIRERPQGLVRHEAVVPKYYFTELRIVVEDREWIIRARQSPIAVDCTGAGVEVNFQAIIAEFIEVLGR